MAKDDNQSRNGELADYLRQDQTRLYGYIHSLVRDLNDADDLLWVYRRVRECRATIRGSIYRPNAFRNLIVAARTFAIERANQPKA